MAKPKPERPPVAIKTQISKDLYDEVAILLADPMRSMLEGKPVIRYGGLSDLIPELLGEWVARTKRLNGTKDTISSVPLNKGELNGANARTDK